MLSELVGNEEVDGEREKGRAEDRTRARDGIERKLDEKPFR